MKIGISTSVIQRGRTGIAQYLFSLLAAFQQQEGDHEFVLFVLEEDKALFQFVEEAMQIVTVSERFRAPVQNILWHQTVLPRLARKLKLDLLHIPSYRRLLWPKPCPLVATIHDLAPFHVAEKYDRARMFYGRVVARQLAQRQDAIIAISENTARDVVRFFDVSRERISVVHNGLDHEHFFPAPRPAARQLVEQQHGLKAPFFLYVARLEHPAKNHVRLIRAFEAFKAEAKSDWNLVFGGSDWHGAEMIHRAIHISPNSKDIRCLGFVSSEDLPVLYRAAGAFIYPSLHEGFGLPPVEAMACGCPVICSSRGSLGEVVGNAAVIIDPENIADMKQRMVELAADANLQERLRQAGLIHARHFSWRKAARETLQVYSQTAQRGAVPHPRLAASISSTQ